VLAHLVDVDPIYTQFYKDRSDAGDFIIMDNGAFELGESYHPDKLIELGHMCGADALVLPDYPFQPYQVTINAAVEYIPQFKEAGFKTFFVPQSEVGDWSGFIESYRWAAENPDVDIIGMSILNIPNALPDIDPAYVRVVATKLLIDLGIFNFNKYHHYLGLNSGPKLEIPSLLKMGALDSCDSSNPVWMAILGHSYTKNADSYLSVKKVKKHVEFDLPNIEDSDTHTRIFRNVMLTVDLFKDHIHGNLSS
jgi:hypothetical protein